MMYVKATREGLAGGKTYSGYVIDNVVPFVALPSRKAIGKFVRLWNPRTGKETRAIVLDIGPWNTDDDDYVLAGHRPQAESGKDMTGRTTNGAGIDLGEVVWAALGMTDNTNVCWEFI